MTLAAFARLLGAPPKWVLNTVRALHLKPRYTVALAQRFAIMRAISDATGMTLPAAYGMAREALNSWPGDTPCLMLSLPASADVGLTLDVYRLLASVNVRLADVRESYAPMVRGRPRSKPVDALAAATDWGLDLSLIRDNLRQTPLQLLRQLDAMHAFARNVRRTDTNTRPRHV